MAIEQSARIVILARCSHGAKLEERQKFDTHGWVIALRRKPARCAGPR
jgi:hypothetical protein